MICKQSAYLIQHIQTKEFVDASWRSHYSCPVFTARVFEGMSFDSADSAWDCAVDLIKKDGMLQNQLRVVGVTAEVYEV